MALHNHFPKIGVLALMLPDYEELFPGITHRQESFVRHLLETMSDLADFHFTGAALGRSGISQGVREILAADCQGILVLPLTYSQGQYLARPLLDANLPVSLVLVQPDETAHSAFAEIDLTVNQAIHGSQDQANNLTRAGIPFVAYAGGKEKALHAFVEDFAQTCATIAALRRTRIGIIGKLPEMGDVITDDMAFFRRLGPEFVYDSVGNIWRAMESVNGADIDEIIARDNGIFDVDVSLTTPQLQIAARMYLGIKAWLEAEGYQGFTIQFSEFGADGRFSQLPLLAASHLMADGYGYAAEGDASCAALLSAMQQLCGPSNFTEMYMMDLERNAILFCHAGEGNWRVAKEGRKPRLIDRPLSEGGLDNPPTPIFTPLVGAATVMSLIHKGGDHFVLLTAAGTVMPDDDLQYCEMPYMFFRPDAGVENCARRWLEEGGTHHEVVVFGEHATRLEMFCKLLSIDHVSI